jgi:1-acyl-sn-glycerol-3-phosphate acyltransferase
MLPAMRRFKKLRKTMGPSDFAIAAEKVTGDWAMGRLRQTGAKVTVNGTENIPDGAVLFVSNHQSAFDIALFMALIRKPKGFVAKVESRKVPLVTPWMEYMDCLFIDRDDMRQMAQTVVDGIKVLKNGHSLVIFPEGTRSKGGPVIEFKAGSFKLATKAKVPVVPVTIDGTFKIMEANKNRIKPADVTITIHSPIETAEMTRDEQTELPEKTRQIIISGLSQ